MLLTKELLLEMVREVVENNYFGKGVKQIIELGNDVYKNDNFIDEAWLTKNVGPRLGSGYSRIVYRIANSNMVLKIALPQEMSEAVKSNQWEIQLFNKYPDVFPKTYTWDRSEGGPEWLVIEKVIVIDDNKEYEEVIAKSFRSLSNAANLFLDAGYKRITPSWVFERLLDTYDEGDDDYYGLWLDIVFHSRLGKGVDEDIKKAVADESWFVATDDVKLMNFITTCKKLGVNFDEIRYGNVGTNMRGNKLILIDISKFDFEG